MQNCLSISLLAIILSSCASPSAKMPLNADARRPAAVDLHPGYMLESTTPLEAAVRTCLFTGDKSLQLVSIAQQLVNALAGPDARDFAFEKQFPMIVFDVYKSDPDTATKVRSFQPTGRLSATQGRWQFDFKYFGTVTEPIQITFVDGRKSGQLMLASTSRLPGFKITYIGRPESPDGSRPLPWYGNIQIDFSESGYDPISIRKTGSDEIYATLDPLAYADCLRKYVEKVEIPWKKMESTPTVQAMIY